MAENLLTQPAGKPRAPSATPLGDGPHGNGRHGASATAPGGAMTGQPAVPEKFRDPATGEVRVEALLKSYLELEKRLSRSVALPDGGQPLGAEDRTRLMAALGVPDTADGYEVAMDHGLFQVDAEMNRRMHAAGFTPDQVQLVYDLAAERLVPLVEEMAAEFEADREIERLVAYFGGEEKWREISRQMLAWARKTLPAEAVEGLSASFDGVMALYGLMTAEGEPAALAAGDPAGAAGETELHALMRDPKYWRDKDPGAVAKVTEGFKRLYPERG